MCNDMKWKQKLAEAVESNIWGMLDVYSDGEADRAGKPEAGQREQQGWEAFLKRWTPPGLS